jgi:hypothetical protein
VICATAQRTADAAIAKLPASLLARPAAELQTRSAKTRTSNCILIKTPPNGGVFCAELLAQKRSEALTEQNIEEK